jgi:hypothetical protein
MFNLFKKKSKIDKLQEEYQKLLQESFTLSKTNRTESDRKAAEANVIMDEITKLTNQENKD